MAGGRISANRNGLRSRLLCRGGGVLSRTSLILASVMLAPVIAAFPAQAKMIGALGTADQERPRLVVDATYYPFSAMGRLQIAGRAFCSATLISPSVVLTAGHCLWDKRRKRWWAASDVHFVAGYQRSRVLAHGRGTRYFTPLKERHEVAAKGTLNDDWALVELDQPIGQTVGWLGLTREDETSLKRWTADGELMPSPLLLTAYRSDRAHAMSLQSPCRVLQVVEDGAVVVNDCQVVHGSSGSALVSYQDGHFLVIGVTSARVSSQGRPSRTATVSTAVFNDPEGSGAAALQSFGVTWGAPRMESGIIQKGLRVLRTALQDGVPVIGKDGQGSSLEETVDALLRRGPLHDKNALPPLTFPK